MNLLSLEQFRRQINYHPYHFFGLADSQYVPVNSNCNDIVTQYSWQAADRVGRVAIVEAIEYAESRLLDQLGYSVAPHFGEQTVEYPRYLTTDLSRFASIDATGRWLSVTLAEKKIQALGVELLTALQTAVTLTYSDTDNDNLDDTFTLTTSATTTETDPDKIAAYFSAADRLDGDAAGDAWRILPVKVTINANGTVTITGRSWMLVRPILYQGVGSSEGVFGAIDPTNAANFASTLDVYLRTTNPNGQTITDAQGEFIWEAFPWPSIGYCCGNGASFTPGGYTDPASYFAAPARIGIRDAELGEVIPGTAVYDSATAMWNAVSWGLCAPPDRVTVRYFAGAPLVNHEMQKALQTVVARLAMAELPNRICACDAANRELYRWQVDLAMSEGETSFSVSDEDLSNPFGTRAGQVYAWKYVKDNRILQGFAI